jgi:hypothetical protein
MTGQTVMFTATVSPVSPGTTTAGYPTGTVTFKDGATTLGTATLTNGVGSANFALAQGNHQITATYGGDGNFNPSPASPAITQTVNPANTTTAVVSSQNPSTSGQSVTFTATVSVTAPGTTATGNPTGTVTFKDGATTLGSAMLNGSAVATFSASFTSVGNHSITAVYAGDSNFVTSTSAALTQTVNNAVTATTTTLSFSPSPSSVGQAVIFTATVSPAGATGTVTFTEGSTTLGTGALSTSNGVTKATLSYSQLLAGSHTVTASYGGDSSFAASSGTMTQTVNAANTTTAVTASSPNPSVTGQAVTFTATVSVTGPGTTAAGYPTGTVTFKDGSTTLGTATLNGSAVASATFALAAGGQVNHQITATYNGDANFNASLASPAWTQTVNPASTSTGVASAPNPASAGQTVTFTATVSVLAPGTTAAGSPTGTVAFLDGSTTLGTGTLSSSGQATFTTSSLAVGTHAITAAYQGDSNFTTSSGSMTQTVNPVSSATVIEDFEHGLSMYSSSSYYPVGFYPYARTSTSAKHDGSYGLDMPNGYGWIYRSDMVVQQGKTISVWVEFSKNAFGRAYFGFGASARGTLSVVLAADTSQLLIQDNSNYNVDQLATTVGSAPQGYQPSHWYQLQVTWASGGSITGRLYDSDGTTLLGSVQGTDTRITAGGIAFLSSASAVDKYFDTVTVTNAGSPAPPGGSNSPASALGMLFTGSLAGMSMGGPAVSSTAEQVVPISQAFGYDPLVTLRDDSAQLLAPFEQTQSGKKNLDTADSMAASPERLVIDAYFADMSVAG